MKKLSFVIAVLLISYGGISQSLTGLWDGTFYNDSTTLRKDQPFEIALTEYRGKVYGYSRREFIKNDTLYFVLKRVKGKINGDVCEVTEDEFISHNLPTIDKGVKITYTFHLNKNDSTWSLDGRWKTNQVVRRKTGFYSLTGNVGMTAEKDLSKSKLFPHLAELKLDEDIPFYASYKHELKVEEEQRKIAASRKQAEDNRIAMAKAEQKKKEEKAAERLKASQEQPVKDIAKTTDKETQKEQGQTTTPAATKTTTYAETKKEITKTKAEPEKKKEDIVQKKEAVTTPPVVTANKPRADTTAVDQKSIAKTKAEPEDKKQDETITKDVAAVATPVVDKSKDKAEVTEKPTAAINVEKRKSETIQFIEFKSDSLTLSLYDNGEIDGDTISVLINGEVIMARQGLKASAIKKTVYITPAMQDSFTLVLYAENLGLYPPNTGLIIVRDGEDSYQVRFSADLQKNVAVLFKRKKK